MGAGSNPWSIWSDGLLLPVWFIRLILFDVLLWDVSPPVLVGDALWFSVMAVMCRVHSLALAALVACQVGSLFLIFGMKGLFSFDDFSTVRFGMYSVTMLVIVACAYFLDEQSRLQSFGQLTSLEDRNARLADQLLRWKFIPSPGSQTLHGHGNCGSVDDDASRRGSSQSSARSILRRGGAGAAGQVGLERAGLSVRFRTPGPDPSTLVQTSRPRSGSFLVREQATPLNLHDVME
ncbi:unnamed protein product [Prorocentrum cordatum]|uniref:Transmembrane protein n=1 Tax=Prorocentrum cordatum TaxID=2364126 RepID=A0ABN9UN50_9DINO|nr:unnamed protein product [Polarella glacialis]